MRLILVVKQSVYKWPLTVLLFLALLSSVTLYVYTSNTSKYANRSMQLIVKKMGHNLLFLPKDAEPSDAYWSTGKERLFDEKHASILASRQEMASRYFVSVIQQRRIIEGKELILTGIKPVPRKDETAEKGNMIKPLLDGFAPISF